MKIGEKIMLARKKKGWTQEQLAEQLQVSFQAVSLWERNESLPDTDHLVRLSRLLSCSLDDLLSEEAAPQWTLHARLFNEEHMYTLLQPRPGRLAWSKRCRRFP